MTIKTALLTSLPLETLAAIPITPAADCVAVGSLNSNGEGSGDDGMEGSRDARVLFWILETNWNLNLDAESYW